MTTGRPASGARVPALPPLGRLVSWIVSAVVIGWVVVYNILRLRGDSPSEAAAPSLMIGAAAGVVGLAVFIVVRRRLIESGRLEPHTGPADIPAPEEMDGPQRDVMRLVWPVVAALALAELVVGVAMIVDWVQTDPGGRSTAKVVLAAWYVFAGVWMLWEASAMRRLDAEGVDSVALGAVLTAVLGGVALSRSWIPGGQIVLIVLGGLGGGASYLAMWRLSGARGVPAAAIVALIVAALAIVLPLAA